ncbi:MAG: hypothetical protein HXY40_09505 [Chloroflexi bacterium]|nr:hypothetical protein [Chloroflexota bacterium]
MEMLDRTFRIYRDHFLTFIVPVAVISVPLTLINSIVGFWYGERLANFSLAFRQLSAGGRMSASQQQSLMNANSEFINVLVVVGAVTVVTGLLQTVLLNGIITYLTSESQFGRRATLGEAFRVVFGRMTSLTLSMILLFGLMIALLIGLSIILFACGLGFGVLLYVWLAASSLLVPVMVLERTDIMLGLRRAWSLGKMRIWPITGMQLAVVLISYVVALGLAVVTTVFTQNAAAVSTTAGDVSAIVLQALVTILLAPVLPIAMTLLYYDARVRSEGFDIALKSSGNPDARPADLASPQPTDPFLSGKDLSNIGMMIALSMGLIIGLFCLLSAAGGLM